MYIGLRRLSVVLLLSSSNTFAEPPREPIAPIPASLKQDPARALIGRQLFNDPRLSANSKVSCASCHDVSRGGADSKRNVAVTAPYFHDASAKTLDDAVDVMFKYQLGRTASAEDKSAIVKFLGTLTGETESDAR